MQEYLILISIGPVQDFIASARKLRDLWFGSYLLSELSKVVARTLNENGAELIFPAISEPSEVAKDSELIVANKILAKTTTPPNELIKEAKDSWQKAQIDFALIALDKIKQIKQIKINDELYKKQIGDSGEFFASWVELTDSYQESKDKVEKLLAGRKNLRAFSASSWDGSGLLKSSLDGARETVFIGKPKDIRGLIKKNEYLDTLGCIKRFYPLSDKRNIKYFDDLSDIAIIPYLKKIGSSEKSKKQFAEYESYFISRDDGLRSERTKKFRDIDVKIISDFLFPNEQDLDHLPKGAWQSYKKLISKDFAGEPPKYSCILVGDGDKMGVALDNVASFDGHQAISRQLNKFANEVQTLIEKHDGSLIYAGGDDVMAYLPLHKVIKCSNAIRILFSKNMTSVFDKLNIKNLEVPTFSIGVAVVHHSMPLDKALNLARDAEKVAKSEGGRNAFAIIQSKRSGNDITIYGKWDDAGGKLGLADRLLKMVKLYNSDDKSLSHTLGYQLRQAIIESGDEIKFSLSDKKLVPENAAAVSVLRIFEQKKGSDDLKVLLDGRSSIKRLSDELVVARQLAQIMKMANGQEKNR